MRGKIFILSLLIIKAYSISNERVSNYPKQGIKKFLVFDNEYENRPNGRIFHTLNNRTDNRTHPTPHNRTDPYPKPDNRTDPSPKPDNRTDPSPKPDNRTDNRTDPTPKPDNRTDNRTDPYPKPDNRTDPSPKPDNRTDNRTDPYPKPDNRTDNRTDPYPKPDNRTDNRTDPSPKPDNRTDNRTDPYPKPDNRTDNKSYIDLVSINTNAVEHSILAEDFLLVFKNADTNPRLIYSIMIKKYTNGTVFKFPLYCYKIDNIYLASCLGDVKRIESDIYFVTGIEYGNELINLNKSLTFYIRKSNEDQRRNHSINF